MHTIFNEPIDYQSNWWYIVFQHWVLLVRLMVIEHSFKVNKMEVRRQVTLHNGQGGMIRINSTALYDGNIRPSRRTRPHREVHMYRYQPGTTTCMSSSLSPDNGEDVDKMKGLRTSSDKSLKAAAEESNKEVYDALIKVFKKSRPEEWKKLIVYSSQWSSLADGVFDRIEEIANEDSDGENQLEMRRFLRRLKNVSQGMSSCKELLEGFRTSPSREWESMVSKYRSEMDSEFFEYIELRLRAAEAAARKVHEKEEDGSVQEQSQFQSAEAEALAALGAQLAVLVDSYDRIIADETALQSAGEKFAELLQSESMEGAEAKLDEFAASGRLDPALLLTMAKAYSGVKETDVTKEEVKDIMAHLYFKAKEKFAAQAPPEARILKFLLSVDSESDRMSLMEEAFKPGAEISTSNEDFVHTTPNALVNTIDNILAVYDGTSGGETGGSMAGQAASLMNPEVIERLRGLERQIRKHYL